MCPQISDEEFTDYNELKRGQRIKQARCAMRDIVKERMGTGRAIAKNELLEHVVASLNEESLIPMFDCDVFKCDLSRHMGIYLGRRDRETGHRIYLFSPGACTWQETESAPRDAWDRETKQVEKRAKVGKQSLNAWNRRYRDKWGDYPGPAPKRPNHLMSSEQLGTPSQA